AGPNELLPDLPWAWRARSLPRTGSAEADLSVFLGRITGKAPMPSLRRSQRQGADGLATGSDHLARLWASQRVLDLMQTDPVANRDAAVTLSAQYRLVTPVSGAVVLETTAQYEQAGHPSKRGHGANRSRTGGLGHDGRCPGSARLAGLAAAGNGGGVMPSALVSALVLVATWDSWRWYFGRIAATPEDVLGLIAALSAVAIAGTRQAQRGASDQVPLVAVAVLLAGYAASRGLLPPIVRAGIAAGVALFSLHVTIFRRRPPAALWGLAVLVLPV